jgi:peptidoglycan/LPS O-acetylase OafA/YrhL
MVFVYHNRKYWRDQLHPEILRLFNEFHIGVALFFVLSGFLIAYTYGDEPMRSGKAYTRYMLLRLARIMPLYWLVLTAYYLDMAYGKRQFSGLTYSLLHGFSDKHNLDGIAQAWSLNVEMSFYFLAPLLCLLQRKHLLYLLGALLLLFGISWGAGETWYRITGNPDRFFYPLKFISDGIFTGRCTEFLSGMLLAAALRNKQTTFLEKMRYKTWIGFLGILITAYGIGLFQVNTYDDGINHTGGLLLHKMVLPFFVALSLAGLIYERTWLQWFFSSRLLVLLGNASFAFYLVHISYVNLKIREYASLPDRNFILLWLVAIVLYLLFEKPVYMLCRKWLK